MDSGTPKLFRPAVVQLEGREVPAVVSATVASGVLTVTTDNTNNVVIVSQSPATITVTDGQTNQIRTFARPPIGRVDVVGGSGNDSFSSRGNTGITVRLLGKGGNDLLDGDGGRNVLVGGDGNDTIYGRGGDDMISGLAGNDFIFGGAGNDILTGDDGNDTVNGGNGVDAIAGGAGDDILIALDNGVTDTVDAGGGTDTAWFDLNADGTRDSATGLDNLDFLRQVTVFANGADRTLDGDRIADPALNAKDRPNDVYEAFTGRPLFSSAGPSINDIAQNVSPGTVANARVDDGWLLSALGSMLGRFPNLIKSNVVDFADGTYGVNLSGTFIRVDNDLPVEQFGSVVPAYAKVGPENSLWVPIVEKVFATITNPTVPSYNLLSGGQASQVFTRFGAPVQKLPVPGVFVTSLQLGSFLAEAETNRQAMAYRVDTIPAGPPTLPLVVGQTYTVADVILDINGLPFQVVLRNPTGVDGGGSTDANPLDGYVTLTIDDLFLTTGVLDVGDFNRV